MENTLDKLSMLSAVWEGTVQTSSLTATSDVRSRAPISLSTLVECLRYARAIASRAKWLLPGLTSLGIQSISFNGWDGFDQDCLVKREEVREEIDRRRYEKGTYKHARQTQAEAEVAIIVDGIRTGKLQPPGGHVRDAFFISSTRVVDRLPNLERRICLFPEGLAQWLWSSQATSPRHAELVFQQLLWELTQGGVEFVDRATLLRRFSGVIEAAKTDLKSLVSSRREFLVEKYGPDPAAAFMDADPLDLPRLTDEVRQENIHKDGGIAEGGREARAGGKSCGEN